VAKGSSQNMHMVSPASVLMAQLHDPWCKSYGW